MIEFLSSTFSTKIHVHTQRGQPGKAMQVDHRDASGNGLLYEMQDHDGYGFPHYWKRSVTDPQRGSEYKEIYVSQVAVNEPVDERLFKYVVPDGYISTEVLHDKPLVKMPDGATTEFSGPPQPLPREPVSNWLVRINGFIVALAAAYLLFRRLSARHGKPAGANCSG